MFGCYISIFSNIFCFFILPKVRVDSGIQEGSDISIYYDPMISKVSFNPATQVKIEQLAHYIPFLILVSHLEEKKNDYKVGWDIEGCLCMLFDAKKKAEGEQSSIFNSIPLHKTNALSLELIKKE